MILCDLNISCFSLADIVNTFDNPKILVTVNSEAIVRAQTEIKLKNIINSNFASLDGQIPLWLFKLCYKTPIKKLSGSDLIYSLSEWASINCKKVFLLGGKEESNQLSITKLSQAYPNIAIRGYSPKYEPYPFTRETNKQIINHIEQFKPQILFVGFGMGKQEYWAQDNFDKLKELGVKLIIGCGGSFDFASGKIKRAPIWIQKVGFESVWRLFKEFKWFRVKRIIISFKIFKYYYKFHIK